jgi:hypothetical protein
MRNLVNATDDDALFVKGTETRGYLQQGAWLSCPLCLSSLRVPGAGTYQLDKISGEEISTADAQYVNTFKGLNQLIFVSRDYI